MQSDITQSNCIQSNNRYNLSIQPYQYSYIICLLSIQFINIIYRYANIDIVLSITSLAPDAGRGSTTYNRIYRHTHNYICAILHIVSIAEIQCTDFCKIEQPNLQNSATIQPETLHLEKADPGGIWNCDNSYGYSA